jgi:serine/threonine-protein kinase
MARFHTSATTRSTAGIVDRLAGGSLLERDQIVASPETGLEYRVGPLLGRGGFGEVFFARRLGRSSRVPPSVCLKVSRHLDSWVQEAYFGQLLANHARAIQLYDRFPIFAVDGKPLYCLVLELATHGDLSHYLARTGKPMPEAAARRQIVCLLDVLVKLHRRQMLHRDLTPFNVFVCDRGTLKLGDFGIARQQVDGRGVMAYTMNRFGAPTEFLAGEARRWQARDDVYQVGQLLAMLVVGSAKARIGTKQVRTLACSDQLKEIIHRCIGHRTKRYETADELIQALNAPVTPLRPGRVNRLRGTHLAFTGIFSRPRRELVAAATRAGAIVHGAPSAKTTVVVRGRPNPQQAAGPDAGLKLMELRRLREKGHRITLIGETQFWSLAPGARVRKR